MCSVCGGNFLLERAFLVLFVLGSVFGLVVASFCVWLGFEGVLWVI